MSNKFQWGSPTDAQGCPRMARPPPHTYRWHSVYLVSRKRSSSVHSFPPTPQPPSPAMSSLRLAPCTLSDPPPSPVIGCPSPGLRLAPIQTRTSTPVSTRTGVRCRVAPHRKFPCGVPAERSSKTLGPITTGPGPKLGYHIWEESLLGSSLHL